MNALREFTARTVGARPWLPGALLLVAYAGLLLALRPADPFEWDELLYQRSLDKYDVADHHPHPPGAPLFVGAARVVRWLVGDPFLAMQLTVIGASVLAIALLYRLALRFGAGRGTALAVSAMLAVVPGFMFHANIGMSDVPSTTAVIAATLACVVAIGRPDLLPLAAGVTALGLGVRPQVALAMLPAGLGAVVAAARVRAWRPLAVSLGVAVGVCLAVWLPAILVTGPARYFEAVTNHARYLSTVEGHTHWPTVPFRIAVENWIVNPLGMRGIAVALWAMAVVGAVAWWRSGRRLLVLVAVPSAVIYLLVGFKTMHVLAAVRFSLPAAPFIVLLAAGVLIGTTRWTRLAGRLALGGVAVAMVAWAAPVYLLRLGPAPVWGALRYVATNYSPDRVRVVYDGEYSPHIEYVLLRSGYQIEQMEPGRIYPRVTADGRDVLVMYSGPVPGHEIVYDRDWANERLLQLAFWRYSRCTLQRPSDAGPAHYSSGWRIDGEHWVLWGRGEIEPVATSRGAIASICPLNETVVAKRGVMRPVRIPPGDCRELLLPPGSRLSLEGPPGLHAVFRPIAVAPLTRGAVDVAAQFGLEAGPFPPGRVVLIPVVAHQRGRGGAAWRTDLRLENTGVAARRVAGAFLSSRQDNLVAPVAAVEVAPRRNLVLEDVLGVGGFLVGREEATGALLLSLDDGGAPPAALAVRARTYDANVAGSRDDNCGALPVVPVSGGMRGGETRTIMAEPLPIGGRATIGAVLLSTVEATVGYEVLDRRGAVVTAGSLVLDALGHDQRPLHADPASGVRIVAPTLPADARLFPFVAIVDRNNCVSYYSLPGSGQDAAATPPLPRVVEVSPVTPPGT